MGQMLAERPQQTEFVVFVCRSHGGKMSLIRVLSIVATLISSLTSYAGDMVRNGGDLIICDAAEFGEHKSALLDYAVALISNTNAEIELPFETISDLSLAIRQKDKNLADDLSFFIDEAMGQIYGNAMPNARNVWKPSKLRLLNIGDEELAEREQLVSALPDSCLHDVGGKKSVQLRQLVAREKETGRNRTTFYFDSEAMELIKDRPDQLSFLIIHEWLWSHAGHANTVRELNWYFHAYEWKTMDTVDFLNALASMGFNFSSEKTEVSPTIRIAPAGGVEPNGHERFTIPGHFVVSKMTTKVTFKNSLRTKVAIGAYIGSESRELCSFQIECTVDVSQIGEFPAALWVQREPMLDPIWDIKFISLFK
jgi:hypothetical protein